MENKDRSVTDQTADEPDRCISLQTPNQATCRNNKHKCILCSKIFVTAQELGRHTRLCKPLTVIKPELVRERAELPEIINSEGHKIWQCDLCDFR